VKKLLVSFIIFTVALYSCRQEKKPAGKPFISVPSLIRAQVNQVDTSLYVIRKIVTVDSTSDTSFVRREDFAKEAKDFLDLPDLSDPAIGKDYKQDSAIYEEYLNMVILTYRPKDRDALIRKQELLITPSILEGDHFHSILVSTYSQDRNGSVQKEMLWRMDKNFQVVTTVQSPGQPEKTTIVKLIWNEDDGQ
jgi:hypothetical protein